MSKNILKNAAILRNFFTKRSLISSIMICLMVATFIMGVAAPKTSADQTGADRDKILYIQKANSQVTKVTQKLKVVVTAYSSTPEETDDTPFITASGQKVAEHIIANNMLPFGTKIRIPELYGDKIFVVGDRMNKRKSNYHVDLWMPSKAMALKFGVKTAEIEILEN